MFDILDAGGSEPPEEEPKNQICLLVSQQIINDDMSALLDHDPSLFYRALRRAGREDIVKAHQNISPGIEKHRRV